MPPSPIREELHEWKLHCKHKYQSEKALNAPPHITLHMPFLWKSSKEERLLEALKNFVFSTGEVDINLSSFGCFPPKVIYVAVAAEKPLQVLQLQLVHHLRTRLHLMHNNYKDKPFTPHITIAFRDLKKAMFETAWDDFKNKSYIRHYKANGIALLKHVENRWDEFCFFPLKTN